MKIKELNKLSKEKLFEALFMCCGCTHWVNEMVEHFPIDDENSLKLMAEKLWNNCKEKEWLEAFSHHPRIGNTKDLAKKFPATLHFTSNEQKTASKANKDTLEKLIRSNDEYFDKFGFIFIVFATGKSAEEILDILHSRMINSRAKELKIAAGEQNKITLLRIEKLLAS
jgi:2-oxo-4-hydroxy-4-carboxy-5-ureidoimidazoline decarboxylase